MRFFGPPPGAGIPQQSELRLSVIFFSNADLEHPAVIERLTVRDAFGTVLLDSGPKIGIPHPLNTLASPPQDITTVPRGGTYGISTFHFGTPPWAENPIPRDDIAPGLRSFAASSLSVTVEVSKPGKPRLFVVSGRETSRERVFNPVTGTVFLGTERSSNATRCFRVRNGDDD